jgi:hypothetical protein
MAQRTYRILPQTVVRYGVEMSEPGEAPRILLTCSTEAAADTWISEIKRLSAAKSGSGLRTLPSGRPSSQSRNAPRTTHGH